MFGGKIVGRDKKGAFEALGAEDKKVEAVQSEKIVEQVTDKSLDFKQKRRKALQKQRDSVAELDMMKSGNKALKAQVKMLKSATHKTLKQKRQRKLVIKKRLKSRKKMKPNWRI